MQEIRKNIIVDAEDLIAFIQKSISSYEIEGLSFIGGEPMLQAEGLSEIAKWGHSVGLTVLVFTGFLYEELVEMKNRSVDELISNIDLLVDGPYMQELYDTERDWIGSQNQKICYLTKAYNPGIEYKNKEHQMEVLVSDEDILINGWPY